VGIGESRWSGLRKQVVVAALAMLLTACGVVAPAPSRDSTSTPASPDRSSRPSANPLLDPDSIATAIEFRKGVGLNSSLEWARSVAENPSPEGLRLYGVPLTAAETHQLQARARTADAVMSAVQSYGLDHPDVWGGAYVDSPHGGGVVAQFVGDLSGHRVALSQLVAPDAPLLIQQVDWPLRTLKQLQNDIAHDGWLERHHYDLISVGTHIRENIVLLQISTNDRGAAARILEHYNGADKLQIESDGTGIRNLPTGSLTGIAVDDSGRPVSGLDVELMATVGDAGLGDVGHETDKLGRFEFLRIPATSYEVRFLRTVDADGNQLEGSDRIPVGSVLVTISAGQITFTVARVANP
jgi:hypothetical protein